MSDRPLIVVIEDDALMRSMLASLLRASGFDVVEASTGAEGCALVESLRPRLILLDLDLPDLNGFEVCARLRASEAAAETPILILTGRDDAEAIRRAFESGATDFAVKSMRPPLIVHRIRFMLRAQEATAELRLSEARLAEAQRIARVGNWELDLISGTFVGSSEAFRLLGIAASPGGTSAAQVRHCLAEAERTTFDQIVHSARAGRLSLFHHEFRLAMGARTVQLRGEYGHPDGSAPRLTGTVQDVTEIVTSREQIKMLAYYDSLTGLPNRVHFVERVNAALASARRQNRRVALMVMDLDNFKKINDTLGHAAGDELLRTVAARLSSVLRENDSIAAPQDPASESTVARMGGDEFLLLVVDLESGEQAAVVARRILEAVATPVALPDGMHNVSASIGISIFPEDGDTYDTLLKHADVALYQAKDAGRNLYEFYDRRMSEASLQRMVLESSLRTALADRQLGMAIQPKVSGDSGQLVGGEALLRWRHAEFGAIPPSVFVALAERAGLASVLTAFIVEEVSKQLAAWIASGHQPVPIAINLSPQVFRDEEVLAEILATPVRHGIKPSLIVFEVTESLLVDEPALAERAFKDLRAFGYRIALDDFGTGYSSLSYLRRFPLDAIKIDHTYVRELHSSPRDAAIVKAIVELSTSLGLEPIAEGVETEAQRAVLLGFGCIMMQGYLFGRPQPAEAFGELLRGGRPLPLLEPH
ncbi:MAG: EAL domain-containing protein [Gemmatimonadetes bacterium]|nr:EAL domain-containing protein [Gemmatimonadota bacterium]